MSNDCKDCKGGISCCPDCRAEARSTYLTVAATVAAIARGSEAVAAARANHPILGAAVVRTTDSSAEPPP